jgi:hypothetical protein
LEAVKRDLMFVLTFTRYLSNAHAFRRDSGGVGVGVIGDFNAIGFNEKVLRVFVKRCCVEQMSLQS